MGDRITSYLHCHEQVKGVKKDLNFKKINISKWICRDIPETSLNTFTINFIRVEVKMSLRLN